MTGILRRLGEAVARYLSRPRYEELRVATAQPGMLARTLRPGDVLLVEGSSRIAGGIKYLTQSSWSHSALCVAKPDPDAGPGHEPMVLIEADVAEGIRLVPLSRYSSLHTRICRPVGLTDREIGIVIDTAMRRVGQRYDLKNIIDLARYFISTPPVPAQWRRHLIALGSGDPTRAICSSMIAEAFQEVGYPILPRIDVLRSGSRETGSRSQIRETMHILHHSLFVPRDFDVSPYFAIIKPTLELTADPRSLYRLAG